MRALLPGMLNHHILQYTDPLNLQLNLIPMLEITVEL